MKLEFKNSPTISSGDMAVSKMGLDENSSDMFGYFFRDKVYTDKILAVVRETVSNALDEHVKYNITRDVKVNITVKDGVYMWSCRDYAMGLDDSGIRNIFGMYGGSTKRHTNTLIGGFGIGAISPMAYSDTFYISSFHNGTHTKYVCTLGAGDNGVPVGEIYEVLREPTTESGIEISLDVTKDPFKFNSTTKNFITFLPSSFNVTYSDWLDVTVRPTDPLFSSVINGMTFSKYARFLLPWVDRDHSKILIRMGGIIYNARYDFKLPKPQRDTIVVDVPIGTFTVPMSRESIEVNKFNSEAFSKINDTLGALANMDKDELVCPTVSTLLANTNDPFHSKNTWYSYHFEDMLPDSAYLLHRCVQCVVDYSKPMTTTPSTAIILIPNIKKPDTWIERLKIGMTALNRNYIYVINTAHMQTLLNGTKTLDISDITFLDVKQLGLPKLPKVATDGGRFVAFVGGNKLGRFTAEELNESMVGKYFNGVEPDVDWHETCDDMWLILKRTVGLVERFGTSKPFVTVNSTKMLDELVSLGWLQYNGAECLSARDRIDTRHQIERNMSSAKSRLSSACWNIQSFLPQLITKVGKNPSAVERLAKIKKSIQSESSARQRVLTQLNSYAYTMTRSDFRKILNMK